MDKGIFYDEIRNNIFKGKLTQGVVDTLEAINLALDKHGIVNLNQRAYVLGTAYHESYAPKANPEWEPVREGFAKTNQGSINAVTSLFNRKIISTNYALPKSNGHSYYGRGFVQITWDYNYKDLGKRLGIDLYNNPDLALDRKVAAEILVVGMKEGLFTGRKLSQYFTDTIADNKNARRIVNGTDKADLIAGYATKFYIAITKASPQVAQVKTVQSKFTTTDVNLRSGAGTQFKVITALPKGTEVNVLSEANGWSSVFICSNKLTGFVSSQYLK